jgi:hypothetical protein
VLLKDELKKWIDDLLKDQSQNINVSIYVNLNLIGKQQTFNINNIDDIDDIKFVHTGLVLNVASGGKGTFNGNQIFEGIKGGGDVTVDGDAELIGVGHFTYNGSLEADNVIVNKNNLGQSSSSDISVQNVGKLTTGILTINTGTLNVMYDAEVAGLKSDQDNNDKLLTTGKLTGTESNNSKITITIDQDEEYEFGGLLQMSNIIKEGTGKQIVGQLKTSHSLQINAGEFAVRGDASINGIESGAQVLINSQFYVGGDLTIDVGITEIIKIVNIEEFHLDKFKQNNYKFDGNLVVAGNVTKKGKGIQQFNTITTNLIKFSEINNTEDKLFDETLFGADGELTNPERLVGSKSLIASGELIAQEAIFTGLEGTDGKLSGGNFFLRANDNHSSSIDLVVVNFSKTGKGKQTIRNLIANILTINGGELAATDDVKLVSGIEGDNGIITGKNVILGYDRDEIVVEVTNESTNSTTTTIQYADYNGVKINNEIYFPEVKDHYFAGDLYAYNVTKKNAGIQSFNKLETVNDLNITNGQIKLNQLIVGGTLSLAENTVIDLTVTNMSQINATGEIQGTILLHGQARANTVGIQFGTGVDMDKLRIAFVEEPDQFVTWRLGANSIFAAANSQAVMSELYLTSLLLHDHHSAWNAITKRLNQSLPAAGKSFPNNRSYQYNQFFGQSPYHGNANKSLWVNYIGRTAQHKSTFYNQKFKLRSDGIQVGYNIIPSQTVQYGLLLGYEGQSSSINRDIINADDTYIGIYGTKMFKLGFDLRTIINYGHQTYTSTRYAKKTDYYNKATFKGDTVEGILEVGRPYELSRQLKLRPIFAVELYYNIINQTKEDDNYNTNAAVTYDIATLKQTLLRFGSDWHYEIQRLMLSGGFYYSFNCGTDKLTTTVTDEFGQCLQLKGSKLGRTILSMDFGGQYYTNELQTRSIFANYTGSIYPDRKGTPITGTFTIGFQFDF